MQAVIELRHLEILQQSFLLHQADPNLAAELLAQNQWQAALFGKGQQVYAKQKWQDYLGFVVSGKATAYSAKSSGAAILRSFVPGDMFGAASLYVADAEPFSYIVADQATEVLFVTRKSLELQLQKNWPLAENYIRFLAQRVAFLNRKITALTAGSAASKLAAHILAQVRLNEEGQLIFCGQISKLAQSLGLSRASLYRALDSLTAGGCIKRRGREIEVINWQKLQEAVL